MDQELDKKEIQKIIDLYGTYSEWVINNYKKIKKESKDASKKSN